MLSSIVTQGHMKSFLPKFYQVFFLDIILLPKKKGIWVSHLDKIN